MFKNLKKLLSSKKRLITLVILIILAFGLWWSFTDIRIMFGNYGKLHTYTDIILSQIMILCFPLLIVALFYRSWKFGNKENLNGKTGIGIVSGIIGTIISGASCCGLTLAAYFGLLPLLNFLPFDGIEIKIIGVIGILYALTSILKNLETCKIKKK